MPIPHTYIYYRCLAHIINLGVTDVMGSITKFAALETATAIWEYDPTDKNNRVLGGSVDLIAALRTLGVKVRNCHSFVYFANSVK